MDGNEHHWMACCLKTLVFLEGFPLERSMSLKILPKSGWYQSSEYCLPPAAY
jgi:hypothetical protein